MTSATWADDPARSVSQDRFGRAPFARLVADTIASIGPMSSSTVFGIVGKWGSGKSSVVHMIAETLPRDWRVQYFSPWATSSALDLQAEFVATLDAAIDGKSEAVGKAKESLREYATTLSPLLGLLPGGSAIRETTEKVVNQVTRARPWADEFERMSTALQGLGLKLLIVCDDIDRLDASELLAFLKVVRLLGRFPNVHYLIAYDAHTVDHLLTGEGAASPTASFMEKIVQHPFELPSVDSATRYKHVMEALSGAIRDHEVKLNESGQRRLVALVDALIEGLQTPRQISRFEQHLMTIRKMVPGEVDILDFAAVVYLRLNHHEVYRMLPHWSHRLRAGDPTITGQPTDLGRMNKAQIAEQGQRFTTEWLGKLEEVDRSGDASAAWAVLKYLYPNLSRQGTKEPREQAFSDPMYEERYFSLGVPENDVSDLLVQRALRSLASEAEDKAAEADLARVILERHESVGRLAIRKVRQQQAVIFGPDTTRRRLVEFANTLAGTLRRDASKEDLTDAIETWLAVELFESYRDGQLDRATTFDLLGEDRLLDSLLRLSSMYSRRSDEEFRNYLKDLTDTYFSDVGDELQESSRGLAKLRDHLLLIARASGREAIVGVFDAAVSNNPGLLANVAEAMVYQETWYDGKTRSPELTFDVQLWTTVLADEVRAQAWADLEPKTTALEINERDTSPANRRLFGVTSAWEYQKNLAEQ